MERERKMWEKWGERDVRGKEIESDREREMEMERDAWGRESETFGREIQEERVQDGDKEIIRKTE